MRQKAFFCIYCFITILPLFWIDPFTENITALQTGFPQIVVYFLWSFALIGVMEGAFSSFVVRPLRVASGILLGLAAVCPWSPSLPGFINDIHVWGQVAGIVLYSYGWLRSWFYSPSLASALYLCLLQIAFGLLCFAGQVSGLCELVYSWGMGLLWLICIKKSAD